MKKAVSVLISLVLVVFIVICISSCLLCSGGHTDNNLNLVCDVCESVVAVEDIKPVGFATQKFHFPDLSKLIKYATIDSDTEVLSGIKDTVTMCNGKNGLLITVRFQSEESVDSKVFSTFDGDIENLPPSSIAIKIDYDSIDIKALKKISRADNIEAIIIKASRDGAIND